MSSLKKRKGVSGRKPGKDIRIRVIHYIPEEAKEFLDFVESEMSVTQSSSLSLLLSAIIRGDFVFLSNLSNAFGVYIRKGQF